MRSHTFRSTVRRPLAALAGVLALVLALAGCSAPDSHTFSPSTGDKVRVSLDTSDGYSMTNDDPFVISKDGKELSEGTFFYGDYYQYFVDEVKKEGKVKELDKGDYEGNDYVLWELDRDGTKEYDYAIKVKDCSSSVLLSNQVSEASAKEVFQRLKITKG
ncbi:MAG: hypothetical protein UHD09_04555 [Bifidobacterium sp.]|nr:hypothetical protein [Bifidobacterium sp.]